MGAYNWRTDQVHCQSVAGRSGQTFWEFVEYLLVECYPSQPILLVMDNATYHHSADVHAALSLFAPRVQVFWLPAYSPDLNLIERFWRHLKDLASANKLLSDPQALWLCVQHILAAKNDPSNPLHMAFSKNFQ